jgi:hypothetical protein
MITSSRFNALVVGMVPAYLFAKADLGGSMTEASIDLQQPTFRVESDCIGEVQAPSNVAEDHTHAAYRGTNLVGSKFRFVGEDVTTGEATRSA